MKLKPYLILSFIVYTMVIFGILLRENAELKEQLWQAGSDIEATDDYYSGYLGDYQVDVYMDSLILRDMDRPVAIFRLGDYGTDRLNDAILIDNQ